MGGELKIGESSSKKLKKRNTRPISAHSSSSIFSMYSASSKNFTSRGFGFFGDKDEVIKEYKSKADEA